MTERAPPAPWRPSASRGALEARAGLLASIRRFFAERGVLEVETPVLSRAGNSDPNIRSLCTEGSPVRHLRTSPEYAMKRLLAAGVGDIYELGRVFRGGESGRWHNPEFTMLEWYRLDRSYLDLADEVVELVRYCGRGAFDDWPVQRVSYRDLFLDGVGLDPFRCSEQDLADCAAERGIRAAPMSHAEWQDLLLAEVLQPSRDGERLTVLHDFPPEQAALARVRPGSPALAERFEVFIGAVELANGYQELADPEEQRRRFERERRHRELRGEPAPPLDERLLEALAHGLPECSGVALGVDRLLMAMLRLDHVDAVLAFPDARA